MAWPKGTPQWMVTLLGQMQTAGELHGVPPQALAAVADNESGYENAGAGVNSAGYGGYFGLGANQSYPGGGTTAGKAGRPSTAMLNTDSPTSFVSQAKMSSAEIAWLDKTYAQGNIVNALADYVGGPTHPVYAGEAQIYTQTVLGGNGQAGGSANATLTSYVNKASGSTATTNGTKQNTINAANLSGSASILAQIDAFLNPGTTKGGFLSFLTITGDVKALATMLFARGIFSLFFLGITAAGIYLMVKGPAAAGLSFASGTYFSGVRARQADQRLNVMQQDASTRAARELRLGGTNP